MKPVRRNVAHLSQAERDAFVNAIVQLDTSKVFPDGVSYWDKQDQIHQATHVHGGAAFLPWHRELLNRFEAMLQEVDPSVALHYWDWTEDPRVASNGSGGTVNLFTAANFGSSTSRAGVPFDSFDNGGNFAGSRDDTGNPADPPQQITRNLNAGAPGVNSDNDIITSADGLPQAQQWAEFRDVLESSPNHNSVHGYFGDGSTIKASHSAFEDPFVFLLHSNIDRLWAMWQMQPGYEWRLDPSQTYGDETGDAEIIEYLEPWSGTVHFGSPVPPWDPGNPDNEIELKNSRHPTVVQPPCYDTLPVSVELQSPSSGAPLTFNDIPEGTETVRAAVFAIRACEDITFDIIAGPGAAFGAPLGTGVTVPYNAGALANGYVWVSYQGTTAGAAAAGSVTIRCNETGEEWIIPITANTITKPKVASMLVLDKSGSMAWSSGIPGETRLQVLKWAAPHFVHAMGNDDGIGIVSFDHDAYPVMPVTPAGSLMFGAGRAQALNAINLHDEDGGATSIGDGLDLAHATVDPVGGYDHKALIVFTDGQENTPQYIADVAAILNERVFAIGLGRADQLDVSTLDTLTSGSGGYMVMTGDLDVNDQFRLSKYFLQILAGVTNTAIVVDPESTVLPGTKHRIPFTLTGADTETDIILLSPDPWALDFYLETPDGKTITPADAAMLPAVTYATADTLHMYRATLPIPVAGGKAHGGTWHAVISVDAGNFKKYVSKLRDSNISRWSASTAIHGIPYNLGVYAKSNLRLRASVIANSHEPGATAMLRAVLTESDLPVDHRAVVRVVILRPDGTTVTVPLTEGAAGEFERPVMLSQAGVYQLRYLATGTTRRGQPFTREELRSIGIAHGADTPRPRKPDARDNELCRLLACLLADEGALKLIERLGLNPKRLLECLKELCRKVQHGDSTFTGHAAAVAPATAASASLTELRKLLAQPEVRAMLGRLSRVEK
ncbi:MAG: tyrosinase [Gammaproteobacteria bacterium]|nr:MAG: tyrosinase [Gammaproteobacteria bacterium]TND02612.1 MAG: tyrosinase [Gammaproteobacteria bacterium]